MLVSANRRTSERLSASDERRKAYVRANKQPIPRSTIRIVRHAAVFE